MINQPNILLENLRLSDKLRNSFFYLQLFLFLILIFVTDSRMKHKMFNVRNLIRNPNTVEPSPDSKPNSSDTQQKALSSEFSELISILKGLANKNSNTKIPVCNPKEAYQVEARDREVLIEAPSAADGKMSTHSLKLWISNVMKTVASSAFHSFSKGEMSFEQAKVYCSENIFKNIVLLSKKHPLSAAEMKMVDQHIKKGVLTYLSAKYPLTDSSEVNKKLEAVVHEVDNIEALTNNYMNDSKVVFEFRENGNYNDLIMQMINEVLEKIDEPAFEETSNYQDFENFMSSLFEKVEDSEWMRSQEKEKIETQLKVKIENIKEIDGNINIEEMRQSLRKQSEQREKYKRKVKEYTHFKIGRKIRENTAKFTDSEIQNGNIVIKSPQVLRILTKWCEELQQKYHNSYYSNRSESVKLQRGGFVNNLLAWMREEIDEQLSKISIQVEKMMIELLENNYEIQSDILENELQREGSEQVDQTQRVTGKFSYKIEKNLHTCLITYLNKLIHGLLTASRNFYIRNNYGKGTIWPYPPNLLTFKIGDLMRCKCSSKQTQILKIYQEIQRLSKQNPQKLKIVRIKNRLKSGTNDILMNLRFNNQILCQVQLAIESKTSDFIKCSNMFHHYLYQLERSLFGPLTELCSIWNTLDRRTVIYEELVQKEQKETMKQRKHSCLQLGHSYKVKAYQKTFICDKCQHIYYHNRFPKNHIKCSACNFLLCARCQIDEQTTISPQSLFQEGIQILKYCTKRVPNEAPLPNVGICIFIESKTPKIQQFNYLTYLSNDYLLARKGQQMYEISSIKTKKDKEKFRKEFLIFQIKSNVSFKKITLNQGLINYILPQLMRVNYKKEKQTVNLMGQNLQTEDCRKILTVGNKIQKESIKNLFMTNNYFKQLPFDPLEFSNIMWLSLSCNNNVNLSGIQHLKNLKKINLFACSFSVVPPAIYECKALEEIYLTDNKISIIEDKIANLQSLRLLDLQGNRLSSLPQRLYQCRSLVILKIARNSLTQISQNIKDLSKIEYLVLSSNQLTSLPESIGELYSLRELDIKKNMNLENLPSKLSCLQNIQILDISQTKIVDIPIHEQGWPKLKTLIANKSNLKQFSQGFKLSSSLQTVNLSYTPIVNMENLYCERLAEIQMTNAKVEAISPSMFKMKNLKSLNLSNSEINDFGRMFEGLQELQILNLTNCKLEKLPNLPNCRNLKVLTFTNNKIEEINSQFFSNLVTLQQLNCSANSLTTFPPSLTKLRKLVVLNAIQNKFTSLITPEDQSIVGTSRCFWPNLKKVYLSSNSFTQIPLLLCSCEKVQNLSLNNNKLHSIRPQLKSIIDLQYLNLDKNQINEIPEFLADLPKLSQILCEQNQITCIPKYLETFSALKKLSVTATDIEKIECIDWILTKNIQFGKLKDKAKQLREKIMKQNSK